MSIWALDSGSPSGGIRSPHVRGRDPLEQRARVRLARLYHSTLANQAPGIKPQSPFLLEGSMTGVTAFLQDRFDPCQVIRRFLSQDLARRRSHQHDH
jgi:hypothetical protein